jgi:hypothetical protein
VYQHPALVEALIKDRVGELQHSAEATAHVRRDRRRRTVVEAARHGTGWLLVDMGLRLATPRGTHHHLARGQR